MRASPDWLQEKLYQFVEAEPCDVMLLSDYGKGGLPQVFLQKLIKLAKQRQIPVVIDPKGKDYAQYAGASLVTPNRKEACEALGIDSNQVLPAQQLVEQLAHKYSIENILVTLGAEGMLGLDGNLKETQFLPALAREVFDVSGAGDTVVSIMALGLGAKASLFDSMRLANAAAGRVVEKWGTQPILRHELLEALAKDVHRENFGFTPTEGKIVESHELQAIVGPVAKRRQKVVFTNGCFDLLHAGHVAYLEAARLLGHILVVAVNSDSSVRKLKGSSRPIVSAKQRMRLLAALSCVDFVVPFSEDTPARLIAEILPDILVKGADYEVHQIVGADSVLAHGGRVERIAFVEGLSTSDIVKRAQENRGVDIIGV
ncbi:MAG: D-glycero-beta-D-manno-heptose 1-phosphate adenylyltransferase [Proteobacteria bacterium]|nr:D-glycero-beta-D-manno-heptose 1-phosphate adenylyltransferase [Pseudomonadota bacterium]